MPGPAKNRLAPLAAAALLAMALGGATPVAAQPGPASGPTGFDPAQLPETKGIVARYTLTPRGEVDGFLLRDGTQVHVPPHLSTQLVHAVRPGDAVTVRSLHALGVPMVAAVSVARDGGGPAVVDMGGGPRGEINGAMLEDGTVVRLPPHEAERFASLLQPGQTLAERGYGLENALGRVIEAQAVGPNPARLTALQGGPFGPAGGGAPR